MENVCNLGVNGKNSLLCYITHILLHPDFMLDKDNKTRPELCYILGLVSIVVKVR